MTLLDLWIGCRATAIILVLARARTKKQVLAPDRIEGLATFRTVCLLASALGRIETEIVAELWCILHTLNLARHSLEWCAALLASERDPRNARSHQNGPRIALPWLASAWASKCGKLGVIIAGDRAYCIRGGRTVPPQCIATLTASPIAHAALMAYWPNSTGRYPGCSARTHHPRPSCTARKTAPCRFAKILSLRACCIRRPLERRPLEPAIGAFPACLFMIPKTHDCKIDATEEEETGAAGHGHRHANPGPRFGRVAQCTRRVATKATRYTDAAGGPPAAGRAIACRAGKIEESERRAVTFNPQCSKSPAGLSRNGSFAAGRPLSL